MTAPAPGERCAYCGCAAHIGTSDTCPVCWNPCLRYGPQPPAPEGAAVRSEAPTVSTGGEMGQILDHLLCASDKKIRYQDAKDALKLHASLRAEVERYRSALNGQSEIVNTLAARADAAGAEAARVTKPHNECRDDMERYQAQRDALLKALREYGQHKPNCDPGVNVCDCGLAAAIKEAE
jgi:hypothetical protein